MKFFRNVHSYIIKLLIRLGFTKRKIKMLIMIDNYTCWPIGYYVCQDDDKVKLPRLITIDDG